MSIAGESSLQAARTTFETLLDSALTRLRQGGLESIFSRRFEGGASAAIELDMPGAVPAFEAWDDEKSFGGFREHTVTIPLKRWEASVKLKRAQVVYDQAGTVAQALKQLTGDVGYLWEKLVLDALDDNPTGIDGVSLLNNSHPFASGGGTWDNLTTDALSFDAFDAGRAAMRGLLDEYGEPLGIEPDILIVHPDEERTAREICQADERPIAVGTAGAINSAGIGATGVTNVYRGACNVVVSPRMTSGSWRILDSRYAPIALGVWRDPEAVVTDDMSAESRQRRDDFLYSVEADANTAGLYPHGLYGKL